MGGDLNVADNLLNVWREFVRLADPKITTVDKK
jgi:hypothetical protein